MPKTDALNDALDPEVNSNHVGGGHDVNARTGSLARRTEWG
jgi:hypothetical protein